jgi:NAD(P)-dependent dehydrogenase (short-subunit alcohol dehydrogenase family)
MDISASTVLVTGANRGFGRTLAAELLGRGATVYAGARNPDQIDLPGAKPIPIDITDPASVQAAAQATGDVTVLINNAGSATGADLLTSGLDDIHLEMDTHYIRVAGLHVGYMDTDMTANVTSDKSDPTDIARIAIDGIAADAYEILADNASRQAQAALAVGVPALYPQLP